MELTRSHISITALKSENTLPLIDLLTAITDVPEIIVEEATIDKHVSAGFLKSLEYCTALTFENCYIERQRFNLLSIPEMPVSTSSFEQTQKDVLVVSLKIERMSVSDEQSTTNMWHVTELDLSWNSITRSELETVGRLTELKKLSLSHCDISGDLGLLKHLTLISLDLSHCTRLQYEDIRTIGSMHTLKRLLLNDCARIEICNIFTNLDLQELDLDGTYPLGSGCLRDIGQMQSLQRLSLSHIKTAGMLQSLRNPNLRELSLFYITLNREDVANIATLTALGKLTLNCTGVQGCLGPLRDLRLTELNLLNNTSLAQQDLDTINRLASLRVLRMRDLYLTDLVIKLGHLNLEELALTGMHALNPHHLHGLSDMPSLKKLSLANCNIRDFHSVLRGLKVEELAVSDNTLTPSDFKDIGENANLRSLRISLPGDKHMNQECAALLCKLDPLEHLTLVNHSHDAFGATLQQLTPRRLTIYNYGRIAPEMACGLLRHRSLVALRLYSSSLDDSVLSLLSDSTLKELRVVDFGLSRTVGDAIFAVDILETLELRFIEYNRRRILLKRVERTQQ